MYRVDLDEYLYREYPLACVNTVVDAIHKSYHLNKRLKITFYNL